MTSNLKFVFLISYTLFIFLLSQLYCTVSRLENEDPLKIKNKFPKKKEMFHVEILDIIGIGLFTWKQILGGNLNFSAPKDVYTETLQIENIDFKLRVDCCHPRPNDQQITFQSENVILAFWGRDGSGSSVKILHRLLKEDKIKNIALIVFSDLSCNDKYLNTLLEFDKLRFVYVTHESNLVDNKRVFLWPLGIQYAAGHKLRRNLELANNRKVDLTTSRTYTANFVGAIRESRYPFLRGVQSYPDLIKEEENLFSFSSKWNKQKGTLGTNQYLAALESSDLTLSPLGTAAECYRTFEALELGSIPIIDDNVKDSCKPSSIPGYENITSPYMLLKYYKAPLKFVRNWKEDFKEIFEKFYNLSVEEKINERLKVAAWYLNFKLSLRKKFINDIKTLFK